VSGFFDFANGADIFGFGLSIGLASGLQFSRGMVAHGNLRVNSYFGWLPVEIARAVPESVVNTIASMICHAHRMGRKEAYNFLKQFVLDRCACPTGRIIR
jgi:hypothetical protein